jgi:hypothetical protein
MMRQHRKPDSNKAALPERPTSQWEIYQWFKARGELAFYYRHIAPKPR